MNNTIAIVVTNSSSISNALKAIPYLVNIWLGTFFWITGNIGCIGNMIVFQSRAFRNRACSIYLLFESIANFFLINFVLVTRVLQKGFQIPLMTRYTIICKLRQFSTDYFNEISFNFFTFATIDRILCTQRSNLYRKWSNRVSLTYKMAIICVVFWFLFSGSRLILYKTINSECGPPAGIYESYDSYSEAVVVGICPLITMFVLAYLLIRSMRNIIERQPNIGIQLQENNVKKRSTLEQMDSQITLMLTLQSIIAIITFLPYATELTYMAVTGTWYKSPLRLAIEKLITEITHVFAYTFFATSFYISIISINGFRQEIKRILRSASSQFIDTSSRQLTSK